MNDVLREKVAELQKKLYKGQQSIYEQAESRVSHETHVQELTYCEQEPRLNDKWGVKNQGCEVPGEDIMDDTVPVRDLPPQKVCQFHAFISFVCKTHSQLSKSICMAVRLPHSRFDRFVKRQLVAFPSLALK